MRRDAVIDKLIGDEVMAFFVRGISGPDYRHQAVRAGLELLRAVGYGMDSRPWLDVGAAVNAGPAYVGNVGGAVMDFTALGDTVNAAARMQQAAAGLHGVRIVHAGELDSNTPQTPGMNRAAAITAARGGAHKLWAGTVVVDPKAKTGAHHHGHVESVIYVISGKARMRWGERLEFTADAGPGDFIYVPPFVPHQEINAADDAPLSCVVVRSDQEAVVINLDLPDVEADPERVEWVDDIHTPPAAASIPSSRQPTPRSLQ